MKITPEDCRVPDDSILLADASQSALDLLAEHDALMALVDLFSRR